MKQDIICTAPLTEDALSAAVADFFRTVRPERERLYDYYRGQQPVNKGEAVRGRPNNLLRVPFPRYITEVHTGYFLGVPPTFSFGREETGKSFATLSANIQLNHLLFDIGRDLSICGAAFALVWLEQSGLKAFRCDPLNCFTLRSPVAGEAPLGTVRLYQNAEGMTQGVLYQTDALQRFLWDGNRIRWQNREENLLGVLPLIPFVNNCEGSGDFESVTGLVDAYNLLISGAMDDMQSVANAFLALYGMQGTTQADINEANRSRILSLSEGGRAEFVVKNLNHEALSQLENNLRRSILQLSMTPDLADESFAGNASGVALQYKLWGIEQVRAAKERSFMAGLHQLLSAFTAGLCVLGTPADLSDARATFYKNLPENHAEHVAMLLSLSDILSRHTILEQLPWVENVEAELQRKAQEVTTQSAEN